MVCCMRLTFVGLFTTLLSAIQARTVLQQGSSLPDATEQRALNATLHNSMHIHVSRK